MFTPDLAEGTHLRLHIGFYKGRVVMDFGHALSHLEMSSEEADEIAKLLIKHSQNARVDAQLIEKT